MKIYKILIFVLLTAISWADIRSDFPSYDYVLTEFNVNETFIDNPEFKRFVQKNKYEYRKRFIKAVNRGGLIIPSMKEMMYQRNISPVFLYVAMVESHFKLQATSRTKAQGLWQITKRTGKELHLQMTNAVDERNDPVKSTKAAIKYLTQINKDFDKWYLTVMAYNCGPGCVKSSIRKAHSRDLATLINPRKNYIKNETKKYIKKVLLMAMIGENYLFDYKDSLGAMMHHVNSDSIASVRVRSGESLSNLASILQMNMVYLKNINPHLIYGRAPSQRAYKINIPHSKLNTFYTRYVGKHRVVTKEKVSKTFHASTSKQRVLQKQSYSNYSIYWVKKGDSLYSIARQYHSAVDAIQRLNNSTSTIITVGQKLLIPTYKQYARN